MAEAVQIGNATLYCGDCLDVLRIMPDASIEAIVTDPPYGLAFMGKHWDYDVPAVEVWQECLRVLKPGGHLLAFGGTRTYHRLACAIEDAGFEVRDCIMWVYGSGFPKSLDVSKAIDREAGAARAVVGSYPVTRDFRGRDYVGSESNTSTVDITVPATDAARQWQGWGTALKPALEPIALCRKPLDGTVAQNVMTHGTGAINVDGCRVPTLDGKPAWNYPNGPGGNVGQAIFSGLRSIKSEYEAPAAGRFPANLIHDGSDEVVTLFPQGGTGRGQIKVSSGRKSGDGSWAQDHGMQRAGAENTGIMDFGDTGSAARFFYCAKADQSDRDGGLDGFDRQATAFGNQAQAELKRGNHEHADSKSGMNKVQLRRNHHPTVKPTDLMRYLCRLVTPPGGTILDPFMGSGSTGRGAALEGFRFIGIEREPDYLAIAQARIKAAQRQPDLFHAAVAV